MSYLPYYPWHTFFTPRFHHYPILPWHVPHLAYLPMWSDYQSILYQYPHQYYQQQGMRGPGLGTDMAGILGFGPLRWFALRGLAGY